MSDFAPPTGPPPPRVPEGWKAVWNAEYKEWFFVNLHTKQSTWEKPTAPAPHGSDDSAPAGPPPGYSAGPDAPTNAGSDVKKPLDSNNPYNNSSSTTRGAGAETDEEMARRLQREEEANARGPSRSPRPGERGAADSYYNSSSSTGPGFSSLSPGQQQTYPTSPGQTQQRGSGGGLFGKLKDKFGGGGGGQQYPPRPAGYGNQPYMGGGYGGQPQGYGGYPQQGGPYQQGPYQQGYPQQGGYMPQGQYMQQQPAKKHGLGAGGAAALGVGGGLLGGMLLADAMEDHDQNEYNQGYDQGYDNGADQGDYGGGDDFGGGDF